MSEQQAAESVQAKRPLLRNEIIAEALLNADERIGMDLTSREEEASGAAEVKLLPIVIELNLQHTLGLSGAEEQLGRDWQHAEIGGEPPKPTSDIYCRADLSLRQVKKLVEVDLRLPPPDRALYRIWPDFPVQPLIDVSCSTVKADAARRSYDAAGRGIVWAVIDSGIDSRHPHFANDDYDTLGGDVTNLHRDFTLPGEPQLGTALTDGFGHGTHVAGIIAGGLALNDPPKPKVTQQVQDPNNPRGSLTHSRDVDPALLAGVARYTKLVSLKVLNDKGKGSSMNVVRALEYVRTQINGQKLPRVHGVNLSVGYEFNARWFACGQSPLCVEVNRLVRSGVVVVIAAGNTGYGVLSSTQRDTFVGFPMTINDPGNADLAITVGSTHRDMPHTYGVSYFSSKGPTGDGRAKPDLVAPGERITSCAAGEALGGLGSPGEAIYVEDSGTSMAAPHVSGAIAAFLSIRREFIGQPEQVKQIFTSSATSLGREQYFQGHGLVDLMRAIQSV